MPLQYVFQKVYEYYNQPVRQDLSYSFLVIKSVLKAHFNFANSSAWSEGHEE